MKIRELVKTNFMPLNMLQFLNYHVLFYKLYLTSSLKKAYLSFIYKSSTVIIYLLKFLSDYSLFNMLRKTFKHKNTNKQFVLRKHFSHVPLLLQIQNDDYTVKSYQTTQEPILNYLQRANLSINDN